MAEGNGSHLSPIWTAILAGAVSLIIGAAAWVFTQGQIQTTVTDQTRRISGLEQNSISRGEESDLARRVGNIETNGSPVLGSVRSEVETNGKRITALEVNIPKSLSEATAINAEQNQKIATIATRQEIAIQRLQKLEDGTVPPLSDRLTVITTGQAVTTQKIVSIEEEIDRLRKWKADHDIHDEEMGVLLGKLQEAKACPSK